MTTLYYTSSNTFTDESAYGNYAIASAANQSVQVFDGDPATTIGPTENWYANQHKGLKYGLGFYGWFDYLPAHAMVDYYDTVASGGAERGYVPLNCAICMKCAKLSGVAKIWSRWQTMPLPLGSRTRSQQSQHKSGDLAWQNSAAKILASK